MAGADALLAHAAACPHERLRRRPAGSTAVRHTPRGYQDLASSAKEPSAHQHATAAATSWTSAAQATLHCLTGCAIGEVLGMVIGTGAGLSTIRGVVRRACR